MATLTSSATYADVVAEYDTTASYEEDDDVALAKRFITACRFLLRYARRSAKQGQAARAEQEFDLAVIQDEMQQARRFVRDSDATDSTALANNPNVTHADFQGMQV